ncbi:hypothetical protein WR25_13333 [Diploscapter pachys]|uniref:C-type lectin domain-containing protein n=1 Tax=Diploscapter pachys TaxID=2018661 RepID=A0A2A2LVA3_9BILA|nr:hypothetical protein WR25_13333 [Diploscapter pachys]
MLHIWSVAEHVRSVSGNVKSSVAEHVRSVSENMKDLTLRIWSVAEHVRSVRYTTATRNQKINITVLIEALCPDCQQLIVNELYPNVYTKFKDYVNIEFIPYGNARILSNGTIQCQHGEEECKINKFESCLIDAVQTQDQYVPLIYCLENQLMKQTPFEDAAEKCFKQLSVSDQTQRMIQGCLVTSLSEKLQKKAADLTANVWPEKHRFVPWILFNGVSIESVQSWADIIPTLICSCAFENNFLQAIAKVEFELEDSYFRIGLNTTDMIVWKWTDGSMFNYWDWSQGEPVGEKCAAMLISDRKWSAYPCSAAENFVCSGDDVEMTTTTTAKPIKTTRQPMQTTMKTMPPISTTKFANYSAMPMTTTYYPDYYNPVVADVVFLIDISAESNTSLDAFKQFIQIVSEPWSIGQGKNQTRIALVAVESFQSYIAYTLPSFSSREHFLRELDVFFNTYHNIQEKQALEDALKKVSSPPFMSPEGGYRNETMNHAIIYLTSTEKFYDYPYPIASNIRYYEWYGIVTVGYNLTEDSDDIYYISGGADCSFFPHNMTEMISNTVNSVQNLVWKASQ